MWSFFFGLARRVDYGEGYSSRKRHAAFLVRAALPLLQPLSQLTTPPRCQHFTPSQLRRTPKQKPSRQTQVSPTLSSQGTQPFFPANLQSICTLHHDGTPSYSHLSPSPFRLRFRRELCRFAAPLTNIVNAANTNTITAATVGTTTSRLTSRR